MTKPAPKGTTVNEIMESAFVKYARLEASQMNGDDVETEAVEPPPALAAPASPPPAPSGRCDRERWTEDPSQGPYTPGASSSSPLLSQETE